MKKKTVTPQGIATAVIGGLTDDMDLFTEFVFQKPFHVCRMCREQAKAAMRKAKKAGLSEDKIKEAANLAKLLFIQWLVKYAKAGKATFVELAKAKEQDDRRPMCIDGKSKCIPKGGTQCAGCGD